jgi:flavin reductase (DIM6/NTAB) family NADH-FMN oxidoreductase RutF
VLVDSHPLTSLRPREETTVQQRHEGADQRAAPLSSMTGIDSLAGAVTVITSTAGSTRFGVTSTSVCSLCMDPPTLITCIPRGSALGREVGRTGRFCVNVLTSEQCGIAEVFATTRGADSDRFRHGSWIVGTTGSPVLQGALASFECSIDLVYGYPEHLMVVGRVQNLVQEAGVGEPLVYVARQYAQVDHEALAAS